MFNTLVSPISGSVAIDTRSQEMQCCGRIIKEEMLGTIIIRDVTEDETGK
jgi:hypothetical protein